MTISRARWAGWGLLVFSLADVYLSDVVVRPVPLAGHALLALGAIVFCAAVVVPAVPRPRPWTLASLTVASGLLMFLADAAAGALLLTAVVSSLVAGHRQRVQAAAVALGFLASVRLVQHAGAEALCLATASAHRLQGVGSITEVLLRVVGQEARYEQGAIHVPLMPALYSIRVTYEKAEVALVLNVLVALAMYDLCVGKRCAPLATRVLAVLVYVPVRLTLMILLYLWSIHLTPYLGPISNLNILFDRTVALLSFVPLGFLVPLWWPRPASTIRSTWSARMQAALSTVAVSCAGLTATALFHEPRAVMKTGTIIVDEHHSEWEKTDRRLDVSWYGRDSGYNYSAIFDYLGLCYPLTRLRQELSDATLAGASVVILKTPTEPFDAAEIDALVRFVRRGGGLFLVGDHTNVFGTSTHLNEVGHRFGFVFRYDSLLDLEENFSVLYRPGEVRHPTMRHVEEFFFATSCSIQTTYYPIGDVAILGRHLKSQEWSTQKNNFFPQVMDGPDMDYGAFYQMVARRFGSGRVVAFSDSTTFSNFAAFLPGRRELFLGTVDWLNRRQDGDDWPYVGAAFALIGAGAFLVVVVRSNDLWPAILTACLMGCAFGGGCRWATSDTVARYSMPRPKVDPVIVGFYAGNCTSEFPIRNFTRSSRLSMQLFSQWVLRLGYFYRVEESIGRLVDECDIIVLGSPARSVTDEEERVLKRFAEQGGKILFLFDCDRGAGVWTRYLADRGVTFGDRVLASDIGIRDARWNVGGFLSVLGGEPVLTDHEGRAALVVSRGNGGAVYVTTLGREFVDERMGLSDSTVPDEQLRHHFGLEFGLIEGIATGDCAGALLRHGDSR